jgi:hypothetical protein
MAGQPMENVLSDPEGATVGKPVAANRPTPAKVVSPEQREDQPVLPAALLRRRTHPAGFEPGSLDCG